MNHPEALPAGSPRLLDRLDALPPWTFTATLYVTRWIVMIPLALLALLLDSPGPRISGSPLVLLLGFLVIAPVLETLVECLLPYAIMNRLGRIPSGRRAWGFIGVSAVLMALWHLSAWPAAIVPSLITGAFLAYTFAHFAPESRSRAFLHTWAFHAGINLVGWTLLTIP